MCMWVFVCVRIWILIWTWSCLCMCVRMLFLCVCACVFEFVCGCLCLEPFWANGPTFYNAANCFGRGPGPIRPPLGSGIGGRLWAAAGQVVATYTFWTCGPGGHAPILYASCPVGASIRSSRYGRVVVGSCRFRRVVRPEAPIEYKMYAHL